MESLETENLIASYDDTTQIVRIVYRGTITAQITSNAYRWIGELRESLPDTAGYGAIFDFSQVTNFQLGNVQTAQQESRTLNRKYDFSHVPVALLAENAYQEGMIKVTMKLNTQQKRLRLVKNEEEALAFFKEWHQQNPRIPENALHIVDTEEMRLYYDPNTKLGIVLYQEIITPEITFKAYQWGVKMALDVGIENVRGGIYDFRRVKEFKQDNFQAVQKESREAHQHVDLSRTPIALLVDTLYQEQMVRVSSKITGQEKRVQIVHSLEEALAMIDQWHKEMANT